MRTVLLSILVIVVAAVAFVLWSYARFSRQIDAAACRLLEATAWDARTVRPEMLATLPTAGQRYLAWTGIVGQPIPSVVRLKQVGRIRSGAEASWMSGYLRHGRRPLCTGAL